jgi:PAS domain S-box-containing protein
MLEVLEHQAPNTRSFANPAASKDCEQIPELYLRAMVDSYSAAVAVLDESGNILYVNRGWRDFANEHGVAGDYYGVGSNYLDVRHTDSDASADECMRLANGIDKVLLGKQTEFQQEYLNRRSIDRRWIRIHATRFDLPRATRILVTHEDVTDSRETGEARRKEAQRLQLLLHVTHILPWEADFPSSHFTFVGEQAVPILGYPIEEWYEPDFLVKHVHQDDRERMMSEYTQRIDEGDNFEIEYRMIAKDGCVVWLHNLVTVLRVDNQPKTIRGFSIDVTKSKQTEAALRVLGGRLINAQEDERRRIARELHDDLNQRMALLSIGLEQLGKVKRPMDLRDRLLSLQSQAEEISADIHRLSYRLHPSKLDHLGLAAAVRSLCQEISARGNPQIDLQEHGFPANLPKDVTLCVFRIVQEALRNCAKHSGAATAHVILENTGEEIRLSVSDEGCGFETESEAMKSGLGFTSMRERLRTVGGGMEIHSRPMQGTVIDVSVPITRGVKTAPD